MSADSLLPVAVAVCALLAITLVALSIARVHVRRDTAVAVVRAAAQLTVVALLIAWVFAHPGAVGLYLAVMLAAATWTSTARASPPGTARPRRDARTPRR